MCISMFVFETIFGGSYKYVGPTLLHFYLCDRIYTAKYAKHKVSLEDDIDFKDADYLFKENMKILNLGKVLPYLAYKICRIYHKLAYECNIARFVWKCIRGFRK